MLCTLTLFLAVLTLIASPALAEISFFGTAKVKPTYYSNFDFNDDKDDGPIVNEGGLTKGEHVRAEVRLGWKASGDKWKVKMIAEGDIIMEKDTVDRSFYVGAEKEGQPNTGGEFGIERAEFTYSFLPQLELETGWDIRFLDIQTGGLLYGDDHPFLGFRGKLSRQTRYEVLYLPIQNRVNFVTNPPVGGSADSADWRVYSAKLSQSFGQPSEQLPASPFYANRDFGLTLSPIYAFSDNRARDAQIHYYGLEATGQVGPVKPYFEILRADGDFDNGRDISSWAMFAGAEVPVCKAFNPYVAFRFTQGDDDDTDDDVEGWVGITDIGRFTGLMGMDGNILGEDLAQSYGATLYSYSPGRFYNVNSNLKDAAYQKNIYGGISNASSGNNPGQKLFAIGARGDLSGLVDNLLYKTQAFFIWYDNTDNLINVKDSNKDVDDYAGTTFDLQLLYALSKNFSVDYIFSAFVPGDGIEDQVDADDTAMVNMLTLAWSY